MFARLIISKPQGFVEASCDRIVVDDFESKFAASLLGRCLLNKIQQQPSSSAATMIWDDDEIVNVEQRLGLEWRESNKAGCYANGVFAVKGEQRQCGRVLTQCWDQFCFGRFA